MVSLFSTMALRPFEGKSFQQNYVTSFICRKSCLQVCFSCHLGTGILEFSLSDKTASATLANQKQCDFSYPLKKWWKRISYKVKRVPVDIIQHEKR